MLCLCLYILLSLVLYMMLCLCMYMMLCRVCLYAMLCVYIMLRAVQLLVRDAVPRVYKMLCLVCLYVVLCLCVCRMLCLVVQAMAQHHDVQAMPASYPKP